LRRIQSLVEAHADRLAFLECLGAGIPMQHLRVRQMPRAGENFGFFAEVIGQLAGETFEQLDGFITTVTREPAGVCALIAPWNAPVALATMQIASCIAFGNSCVLKPSEHTPLALAYLMQLIREAGVPDGVVNLVNGAGAVTGDALCRHPGVDRIAFTGGNETAKRIMVAAAPNLTPLHFELGGKSANIIFDDADIERAIDGSLLSIFSNNGQMCLAGSRILVQRGIAEAFIDRFVARARAINVGDPFSTATEVGPLAFRTHFERVHSHVRAAREQGAELLAGGSPIEALQPGFFLAPAVLGVQSNSLPICQQEVFGPVASVQIFDEDEEAFRIANDSQFGLVAYVWTDSLGRALEAQQRLAVGTVWINTPLARDLRAPFGGFKNSGVGRDGPRQCAAFYTEEKATISARARRPLQKFGLGPSA
jgi:5-carboxymethyl-2-hydroxymuconic-semialdehyde dehydrogenase/aminomuconate-semialdehyde/2-hydroxymuconate-6-semialdehyde dehydrogenase